MPFLTLYFELHQPVRLNPQVEKFFWKEKNSELFVNLAKTSFTPALQMLCELIRQNPTFKISLSVSGTFISQAELYCPEIITLLHQLLDAGTENNQLEFVEQTFYHSFTSLFDDPAKNEFRAQVTLLRQKLRSLFGIEPVSFHNTDLICTNETAELVADMGYQAMLCLPRPDMSACPAIPAPLVGRAPGNPVPMIALPLNQGLSSELVFAFKKEKLTARRYAAQITAARTDVVLLGLDLLHIGHRFSCETGIFHFWRRLPEAIAQHPEIIMANPAELARHFRDHDSLPVIDYPGQPISSRRQAKMLTAGRLANDTQVTLFKDIERMEADAKTAAGDLLERWRFLTTSDHLCYLHEDRGSASTIHHYANPYGSTAAAAYLLTRTIDSMQAATASFNIRKKTEKTPVIIVTPETYRLPTEGMGFFGQYVSGKSGGLGEVVSSLCQGLVKREIPVHFITLNLRRRFREEARLTEEQWIHTRHSVHPENIHLVTSSIFEEHSSAYDGDPILTAAEFQRQIINNYLREIRSQYNGRAVLHSHDWMAGGALSAYARLRQLPTLHTVHNTHTACIPIDKLVGINLEKLWPDLCLATDYSGNKCVDTQATAIKCATKISFVGKRFLHELVEGYFADRWIIAPQVREQTRQKFLQNNASVVFNGISPEVYPQSQPEDQDPAKPGLARKYGPDDNVIEAKKANLVKFQRKMGLNVDPEAILLYWPSRLDPTQKGVELFEAIAHDFIQAHPDAQIAIIGNPVGNGREHADIMGAIACSSGGRIAYQPFNDDMSILGYAAASDVFGASLYEPFGQIDVVGNLYGATATNRDTGGYSDKIIPLFLKAWGAPQDHGNGVLFKTYDTGGLWWGLAKTVKNHRWFRNNQHQWQIQAKRIMKEAAEKWSMDNMVAGYITLYEQLNNNRPLI